MKLFARQREKKFLKCKNGSFVKWGKITFKRKTENKKVKKKS